MGRPGPAAAFQYGADRQYLGHRRGKRVWRRVTEVRGLGGAVS